MKKKNWRELKRKRHWIKVSKKEIIRRTKLNSDAQKHQSRNKVCLVNAYKVENQQLNFLRETHFTDNIYNIFNWSLPYVNIPEVFSFSENADETLRTLKRIFYLGSRRDIKRILIDFSECKVLGLCASTVMDVLLRNIKNSRDISNERIDIEATMPEFGSVYKMLYISGFLKHAGITNENPEPDKIIKLDLIEGGKNTSSGSDVNDNNQSGVAATKITQYFSKCMKTQGFTLIREGERLVSLMVGEVINNCELHSGDFCQWYTIGYYAINDDRSYGECHLAIFNYGQTIYEGLKENILSSKVKEDLLQMSDSHKGFFGIGGWDEERLWTLYALQAGVSRVKDEINDPDRGLGTIRFIDSFSQIGDTHKVKGKKAIMSIISGYTHILFNGKYKLHEKTFDGEIRKIISFNEEKDLNVPPDPECVRKLKHYFPGTMITMKFYLDRKFIEQVIKDGNHVN